MNNNLTQSELDKLKEFGYPIKFDDKLNTDFCNMYTLQNGKTVFYLIENDTLKVVKVSELLLG